MNFESKPAASHDTDDIERESSGDSTFRISSRPVIEEAGKQEPEAGSPDLPRFYGMQSLTLMARAPRSIFAHWDIDWTATLGNEAPPVRKVYLRILQADGAEQMTVEVEPLAGSCYITVDAADTAYAGEIGYFQPAAAWHRIASSEVITTPADTAAGHGEEVDFATVPFHLSFQHMVDLLRISKQENESLLGMLAELRERAALASERARLSAEEGELVHALTAAEVQASSSERTQEASGHVWSRKKIERILGFGNSSPQGGFGGSSRGS